MTSNWRKKSIEEQSRKRLEDGKDVLGWRASRSETEKLSFSKFMQ